MRRVMSLWLPHWPIERWRRQHPGPPSAKPFVLVNRVGARSLLSAVDAAAAAEGLTPGLALADARALRPDLAWGPADPAADAKALARLAVWCGRFSPWTAPHGEEGIWLDVTGVAHLHGGEESLAREVVERLGRQGITARAVIAETAGAAWALARGSGTAVRVLAPGETRAALAGLPVAALRLETGLALALERVGLRVIGDLYACPRQALAARFGAVVGQRLDQALGLLAEPLSPLPPAPRRWVRRRFAEPIATPEDLAGAMEVLLIALCRHLTGEGIGARRLVLTLYRVDGTRSRQVIGTSCPSRDPRHLHRLLKEKLVEIDPGLGVEDMILEAGMVETLAAAQLALPTTRPGEVQSFSPLLDHLANRLGAAALGWLMPRESHVPERAVHFSPSNATQKHPLPLAGEGRVRVRVRPIRLLARPEPIEAMALVPDDPPVLFHWRRLAHRVRRADGPERIAAEWWHERAGVADIRDYYRVEDESGRRFWLYRAGFYQVGRPARWFLHGIFP